MFTFLITRHLRKTNHMKNLFLVSCFLSVLLTKAQDTLLIKSQITFDQSGKPISSSVYDYNKQGINIALTEIKHEEKDTIFHRTIFRKKKELYFIYYNSKSPTIRDTTFFEYNNDTTIIRTKNNSYETLHKRLPNGKFFYSATKTFDKFTSNHQVDSIFYDSTKNIIHTVTYKMNGSPTSFQSGTRELSSGDLNEVRPNKQIPIGGVLKEKWEYKNEKIN